MALNVQSHIYRVLRRIDLNIKGVVISTDANEACVRVLKKSSCGGCDNCTQKNKCHAEFVLVETPDSYDIKVNNDLGVKTGDTVEIYTETKMSLTFALITFIVPLLAAVVSYFVACIWFSEKQAILLTSLSLVAFFIICSRICNRLSSKHSRTSICKLIKENGEETLP